MRKPDVGLDRVVMHAVVLAMLCAALIAAVVIVRDVLRGAGFHA